LRNQGCPVTPVETIEHQHRHLRLAVIASQWWVILLVLLVSVCATIALTGLVVARLSPRGIETVEAVARS